MFAELKKLFELKKGTTIELGNDYLIQVYDYGNRGNLIIDNSPIVHIDFRDDVVEATPCDDVGVFIPNSTITFMLDDELVALESLIADEFITALADYMTKC